MSLNVAVSGIRASSTELSVIGNNIANTGTTGFKSSRGEFADVFASSLFGAGADTAGRGVALASINQSFTQGNISTTGNALDLAISGGGFFALSDGGTPLYSRAGSFNLDRDGFVVNNQGHRLQSFTTDAAGVQTSSTPSDLQIDASLNTPQQTNTF